MLLVANATNFMTAYNHDPFDSLLFLTLRVGRLLSNEVRKNLEEEDDTITIQPTHIAVLVDLHRRARHLRRSALGVLL